MTYAQELAGFLPELEKAAFWEHYQRLASSAEGKDRHPETIADEAMEHIFFNRKPQTINQESKANA